MNPTSAQKLAPIAADVYRWDVPTGAAASDSRLLLEGSTPAFSRLKVSVHTLPTGPTAPSATQPEERLIIVKEGQLTLTGKEISETLEPGSVAILVPGDRRVIGNQSDQPVTYYVMPVVRSVRRCAYVFRRETAYKR